MGEMDRKNAEDELKNDKSKMDGITAENTDVHHARQVSDADRKKSLETMLSPVKPVAVDNIGSEIAVQQVFMERTEPMIEDKERDDGQEMQPNIKGSEKNALAERELPDELEEIEEEFERKLREKEMESREPSKSGDESRTLYFEEGQGNNMEVPKEIEGNQIHQKRKEEDVEREEALEMDLEGQMFRRNMESEIKKNQEELRKRERDFEAELRRKEAEEKEKRQRLLLERERERKNLEEMQKKEREDAEKEFAEIERKKRESEEKERKKRKEQEERERSRREKERKQLEEMDRKNSEDELKNDKSKMDGITAENTDIHHTRQVSDADRKKSLETMLSPVKPVAVDNIGSEIAVQQVFMERT